MWQFLIIFLIVLLLYFHLQFHWKTSNELDVAHISVPNKDTLETVADFKQPFIMDRNSTSDILNHENSLSYKLNIMKDEKLLEIPHKVLLSTLANESGISLNNKKFLNETEYLDKNKACKELSIYLKPSLTSSTHHDLIFGSKGASTILRHHLNYRNYIYVLDGDVELKLVPPKLSHYLDGDNNGESKINIWEREKMLNSSNINTILLPIKKGSVIFLPAYWWYSIRFPDKIGCVAIFSYRTFINTLAILPQLGIKFIQDNNTSYKIESKK